MSGTTANLSNAGDQFDNGKDGVVVVALVEGIPGGKTLDTTGFAPLVIPAGHVVIEETSSGILKPMPVSGAAYGALPVGHTYKGIVVSSIPTAKPFAGIMVRGTVNEQASAYTIASILVAVKAALPLIRFTKD